LILTTPNAHRFLYSYNSMRQVLGGLAFYDSFSGYGPYGRHNREFTPAELRELLEGSGFSVDSLEVCDVPRRPLSKRDRLFHFVLSLMFGISRDRAASMAGAQIFVSARPSGTRELCLPESLYKSTHALGKARKLFPRIP